MDIRGAVAMVVDDEDPVRETARIALEAQGLVVLSARNSAEALLLSDRHGGPIHILITDLAMPPYMDGVELARALRSTRAGLKVLYLCADGDGSFPLPEEDGPESAACLPKPFAAGTLVERVRTALSAPQPDAAETARPASRTILILVPEDDVRASVAGLLRSEGYQVLEVRNIGEALAVCQWHAGMIGLLLADREAWRRLPSEYPERIGQIRPSMRILCASVEGPVAAPLGERVRRALEEWGLEAQGGT